MKIQHRPRYMSINRAGRYSHSRGHFLRGMPLHTAKEEYLSSQTWHRLDHASDDLNKLPLLQPLLDVRLWARQVFGYFNMPDPAGAAKVITRQIERNATQQAGDIGDNDVRLRLVNQQPNNGLLNNVFAKRGVVHPPPQIAQQINAMASPF